MTRSRSVAVLVAIGVLVAATAVAVPFGAFDSLACRWLDIGCPKRAAPPRTPQPSRKPRPLSPVEAALQGRYVALGDSYSSGEGVYDLEADRALNTGRDRCHRSRRSYYTTIALTYRFQRGTAFWACAGARTSNALTGQYGGPPQVGRVDVHTSLITLSIGGNDAGFTPVLVRCIVKIPWSSACREQEPEVDSRLGALRGGLARVLAELTRKAPYARLLVLGYPRPFPVQPKGRVNNLSVQDQRWINSMTGRLNNVIATTARESDRRIAVAHRPGTVEFIDAFDAFAGHEVGSPDPYLNGLDVNLQKIAAQPHSYHPTAGGYQKFATLVSQQIKTGPRRQINQYR